MACCKTYRPEFKDSAVREVVEKSRSATDVANQLGMSASTLRRWVRDHRERERRALSILRQQQVERLRNQGSLLGGDRTETRLKELARENAQLREREVILKGVAAFFAQQLLESNAHI